MTFRARLIVVLLALAAIPLLVVAYGIRREMASQLDADGMRRVSAAGTALPIRLAQSLDADHRRLESLAADLAADNRLRTAIADSTTADRRLLIDWAAGAMRASGFTVLMLQDSSGRILSSGQFRNDFDRAAPAILRATTSSALHGAVLNARSGDVPLRALVTSATFVVRGASYTVTGGTSFDSARVAALSGEPTVTALLITGDAPVPEGAAVIVSLPYLDEWSASGVDSARIALLPDTGPTRALKANVTRWLSLTLGLALLAALALSALIGRLVSSPLVALSERTARLDLDRLDQRFATGREDEIGALERTLDALAGRLRASVTRLREAERAAVTGDLARQVNHDIKNGLAPIRNVLRHLAQTAEREPGTFAAVFAERKATLESSVDYLDALARNYARLSPTLTRGPTDPRPIVLDVAHGISGPKVELNVPDALPPVRADAVVIQRILENIVTNAVEALEGKPGTITIGAEAIGTDGERRVRFTVADTGRGMTREEVKHAFDDFHTTKEGGTGLGLSVVRRLLTDVNGAVHVKTAPGKGTTLTIEIPS